MTSLTIHMGAPPVLNVAAGVAASTGAAHTAAIISGNAFYLAPTNASPAGSNANDGTLAHPWASVGHFYDQAVAGDTLYCRGGTYPLVSGNAQYVVSGKVGTAEAPITVAAYPGEIPLFDGTGAGNGWFVTMRAGSAYQVIDGLHFQNYIPSGCGMLEMYGLSGNETHHITYRNCKFTMPVCPSDITDQVISPANYTHDITVEDNVFIATGTIAAGFQAQGVPSPYNFLVQRNVFVNFPRWAIIVYTDGSAGSFLHNTFIDCAGRKMSFNHHAYVDANHNGTILVQDNAGDAVGVDVYDPEDFALTTLDHNHWDQTGWNADYSPRIGNSAIGGAHDGTDAGAIPYSP